MYLRREMFLLKKNYRNAYAIIDLLFGEVPLRQSMSSSVLTMG